MFLMMDDPSWVCKTETVGPTGSCVIFRDEFPGSKELSEVIDYLIKCKVGGRDVAIIKVERTIGGLNGTSCGI